MTKEEESRTIKLAAVKEIITLRGEIAELKRENAIWRGRVDKVNEYVDKYILQVRWPMALDLRAITAGATLVFSEDAIETSERLHPGDCVSG